MASLVKRGLILSASRISNQAVLLFSPLLLVRILDVEAYGQYREFVLYAMLLKVVISFQASRSLLYFLPMRPEHEHGLVTQNILFVFILSVAGTGLLLAGGDLLRANTSFDFVIPLALYLLFFINLDFLEYYWLAKKRTDFVLYYSTGRMIVRLAVVVLAAWLTHDPLVIAYGMIAVEVVRFVFVLQFAWRRGLLSGPVRWSACKEQLSYFAPLGVADTIFQFNQNLSRLFVSAVLGVVALSYYVIGSYAQPLIRIVRGSVADVVFPEMMDKRNREPRQRLILWQRSNVLFCAILFPIAILGVAYAEPLVRLLFTEQYVAAAPIFAIYAVMLAQDAFDFGMPIRAMGKTKFFVYTSTASLAINAALLYPLYHAFGLIGPALAFLIARQVIALVYLQITRRLYQMRLSELLHWGSVRCILLACAASSLVLLLPGLLELSAALTILTGSTLFISCYLLILYRFRDETIDLLFSRLMPVIGRLVARPRRT